MVQIPFTQAFIAIGVVLANLAAREVFAARWSAPWRAALYFGALAAWLGLAWLHELGAPRQGLPGHVLAVGIALFVVLGFPAFFVHEIRKRAAP